MGECMVSRLNEGDSYRVLWRCCVHDVNWATITLDRPTVCRAASLVAEAVAREREACAAKRALLIEEIIEVLEQYGNPENWAAEEGNFYGFKKVYLGGERHGDGDEQAYSLLRKLKSDE